MQCNTNNYPFLCWIIYFFKFTHLRDENVKSLYMSTICLTCIILLFYIHVFHITVMKAKEKEPGLRHLGVRLRTIYICFEERMFKDGFFFYCDLEKERRQRQPMWSWWSGVEYSISCFEIVSLRCWIVLWRCCDERLWLRLYPMDFWSLVGVAKPFFFFFYANWHINYVRRGRINRALRKSKLPKKTRITQH